MGGIQKGRHELELLGGRSGALPWLHGLCSQSSSALLVAAMSSPSTPASIPSHWAGGTDTSQYGHSC